MFIVLDTQILIYDTYLLRNEIGQQLLKMLQAKGGRLFIPEILRVEYCKHARQAANYKQNNVAANADALQSLVGQSISYGVLSDETIRQQIEDRFDELRDFILTGPSLTDLSGVACLRFVHEKLPSPKAGFKDCMIWEAILTLPAESEVFFVTRDNGFYDAQGFLAVLLDEARTKDLRLQTFKKFDVLLLHLQSEELDLSDASIVESVRHPLLAESGELVPVVPTKQVKEAVARATGREFEHALARVRETFQQTDARVLGFIAYLEIANKAQLFALLNQAGLTPDIARNSAERLAHAGAIRDTGTHYIVDDVALAVAAASRVEEEVINLLSEVSENGH